jgi:hypothetical protein
LAQGSWSSAIPLLEGWPNIQELRDQLFNLAADAQITMSTDEFHAVWPLLDNMYVSNSQLLSKSGAHTTYYYSRLWRTKRWISRISEESRKRARTSRPLIPCPCKLKAVTRGDVVTIMRNGKEGHNHGYDALEFKIPSGMRRSAAQEVAKGHGPSEVVKKLQDPPPHWRSGSFAARWRGEHPRAGCCECQSMPVPRSSGFIPSRS